MLPEIFNRYSETDKNPNGIWSYVQHKKSQIAMYRRLQWGSYATKQPLSKHGSRKMISVANGWFLSTDILAPGSQGVYLTFIVKQLFWILKE